MLKGKFKAFQKRVPEGCEVWHISYEYWGETSSNTQYTVTIAPTKLANSDNIFQAHGRTPETAFQNALKKYEAVRCQR